MPRTQEQIDREYFKGLLGIVGSPFAPDAFLGPVDEAVELVAPEITGWQDDSNVAGRVQSLAAANIRQGIAALLALGFSREGIARALATEAQAVTEAFERGHVLAAQAE